MSNLSLKFIRQSLIRIAIWPIQLLFSAFLPGRVRIGMIEWEFYDDLDVKLNAQDSEDEKIIDAFYDGAKLLNERKWPEAIQKFEAALVKLGDNSYVAHNNTAVAYVGVQDFPNAQKHFELALKIAQSMMPAPVSEVVAVIKINIEHVRSVTIQPESKK